MIQRFFSWNKRVCDAIYRHLSYANPHIFHVYEALVADRMNSRPGMVIVDIGSGKQCPFAKLRDPKLGPRIIGVDISDEELKFNTDVDEVRIADVTKEMPFSDATIDAIVSRSALEHFTDIEPFLKESHRVLRPGGTCIHLFPSKYASFAVVNRMLPHALSRRVLKFFWEESVGLCGFPAHYDHCSYRSMQAIFVKHGFEIVSARPFYYQAVYYRFFVPLYLLCVLYEFLASTLGITSQCSMVLIEAKKK
jgi:ubiquinone/menaquinone biosynthesis C-methylase UbiE